jgi:hypothetical protein
MILRFAAPIGPRGSSTPPEQPVSDNSSTGGINMRSGRLHQIERGKVERNNVELSNNERQNAERQVVNDLSRVRLGARFIADPFGNDVR